MAYIIFELQFKAQTETELMREYKDLLGDQNLQKGISELIELGFCKFIEGQLVINVEKLI